MKQWVTKRCGADLKKIAERYRISEIFAEILVKRGLYNWDEMDQYLFEDLGQNYPADQMLGLREAADILMQKIDTGKSIRIIGDYDVDGVMASYILIQGIRMLGGRVSYQIPKRMEDGYGIRDYMADRAAQEGIDTIVTCDNGISAMPAVMRAKELGLTVIVTDHHEVPTVQGEEQIPPADVVIDPKQRKCQYPFRDLCGAGVAYKLICCMMLQTGRKEMEKQFLPFAAIATVCDVVPLKGENRNIVKKGLKILEQTDQIGLRALLRALQLERNITSMDLGYRIGPSINAAGRLEDAVQGLELLLEQDEERARQQAERLVRLNEERKAITSQAVREAEEQMEGEPLAVVLVLYLPDCHESVAGIVAGRLREKYYRPVYVLTDSGDQLKGSGRSIPGYHMQQELTACQELLSEYGGHAMAAGFSLQKERLGEFRNTLLKNCTLTEETLVEKVYFDKKVSLGSVDREVVRQLEWLEPVGEGNPGALLAAGGVEVVSLYLCGKELQIARIRFREEGKIFEAVDFHAEEHIGEAVRLRYGKDVWERLKAGERGSYPVNLLFVPEINERYGSLQFRVVDCQ